jgi:hypothetical protein
MSRLFPRKLVVLLGFALGASALSCGRDVTGPNKGGLRASFSFAPVFPQILTQTSGAGSTVAFNRVRVVLRRVDNTIALETTVEFPADATTVPLVLNVPLLPTTPASGEPLTLTLEYLNAAGEIVFTGGPTSILVVPSAPGSPAPAPVEVPVKYTGPGASAVRVRISPRSLSTNTNTAIGFTAQAVDASGTAIAGTPIIFGSLDPLFATVSSSGGGQTLAQRGTARIFAALLTGPADTAIITIQPVATALAIVSGNAQSGTVSKPLPSVLTVRVTASDGLGVAGIAVTFAVTGGGGAIGTSAVTGSDGTAQTSWTLGPNAGSQTATATAAGVATGVSFSATATQPKLAFTAVPSSVLIGTAFGATVTAQDIGGATQTGFNGTVTLALGNNPSSDALSGTLTATAVNGVATFSGLSLTKLATGVTLTASAAAATGATSGAFDVLPGAAAKLVFTGQPVNAIIGASIGTLTVAARDAADNVVTSFTGAVSLAIASNLGGSTLSGTTTANAVAGVATFSDISLNLPGAGYTLGASATGLASATSNGFQITTGPAQLIGLSSGGGQTGPAGAALAPITMIVTDASGNAKSGVLVTFAVATGGGSVSPASATTNASGLASTTWTLGATAGVQTMTASSAGLTGSPYTISATASGAVNHWVITTQPAAATVAGVAMSSVVATLKDAANVTVASYNGTASIAIGANPGTSTLSGTATVGAVNGVATFSGLSLNKIGTGYTLVASGVSATTATTTTFNITAAAAAILSIQSGNLQTGTPSTLLALPLVALVTDALGNPVNGTSVTFAIATGGGSLGTASGATNAAGTRSSTWTLGAAAGSQTVTITSTGLSGSPLTATANLGGGPVASSVVAPRTFTITALGATTTIVAQARDAATNPVTGSFTWVSRAAAVATVNSAGLVTAVTNGAAYIVATEAGGTKDSALVTVAQTLATIAITPNPRNVYLGASYAYAASAVDGLGNPLAAQPSFTWSTQSGAIATINASTGIATGSGIGSTLVQATSGAVTGTAVLNVLTRISKIVVSRDSAGFSTSASDTFTLAALGKQRSYRATAFDTLPAQAAMTGVSFAWTSSNTSVAGLDSINTATVRATAAANGNTRISATAQSVTGSALLNVQQVLTSIDLSPTTATIAATGSTPLLARGKDANSNFISGGGPFRFYSLPLANATVDSLTGVVTGVAIGSATITAKDAATLSITSNNAIITISTGIAVPATISFGRDTLTIGRSATISIPIYLSKPNASNVTIILAVRDTFALWSAASVVVPAGQTSVNALLNGHNSGTTQITATDGGGGGAYASATAVLAVQATVRLTTTYYSVNATDQFSTQVLLSDPSPAGGTFVTFGYGTAGRATVSPDPSFIPAGQLSANVVVSGVAAGSTTITPSATGVNGTASTVTVYAANLTQGSTTFRLGAGQYQAYPYVYVSTQASMYNPLAVTLTSGDTSRVTAPASLTIPVNYSYSYYQINGKTPTNLGPVNITASATGWTSSNMAVTVTTPKVGITGGGSYNTLSPSFGFYVYAEDSASYPHNRSSALVVSLTSTDPTVIQVLTPTITIPAGQSYYYNSAIAQPGGAAGTARIIATASGHIPDTTGVYTVTGPALTIGAGYAELGVGQYYQYYYVQVPSPVQNVPLTVTINNTDATIVGMPLTITIPIGQNRVDFTARGKALGQITWNATAPGYAASSSSTVRVSPPRVTLSGGGTMNNFAPGQGFTAYSADSLSRTAHYRTAPLIITYTSTNPAVFTVTGSDTIQADLYYANHGKVTPVDTGTAKLIVSAPGHLPDTVSFTVQTPKLTFSAKRPVLGRRQYEPSYYVSTPNSRASSVTVTVTQARATVDSLTSNSLVIASGSNSQAFTVAGKTTGADTLIASAPGYLPDTAWVVITTPKFTNYSFPSTATTTTPPSYIQVYARDSIGNPHYVLDAVLVKAISSDITVIQPTARGFTILPGTYYSQPQVAYTGPGTASMTYSDSLGTGYLSTTTNTVTVTGPSLTMGNGYPVLGMRQNGGPSGAYVQITAIPTPLTVNLVSTDTTVATVPASVVIPANQTTAYFQINAKDVGGTIQIQATATGYGGATFNQQVTAPKFGIYTTAAVNTTTPRQNITVWAQDANGTSHFTNENVAVTLTSSSFAVGTTDSSIVTIVAGQSYTQAAKFIPGVVGTTTLTASDARVAAYKYSQVTQNVAVNTPAMTNSWNNSVLGIGQYSDVNAYTPDYQTSNLAVALSHFNATSTSPSSATVNSGFNYSSVIRIVAASVGIDTITASASGHVSTKGQITVNQGHSDPISGWPTALSLTGTDSVQVTLYARDGSNGNVHPVLAATTFNISGNSRVIFYTTPGAPITSVTIPADSYQITFWVKGTSTGTDSAIQFTNASYATQTLSLTVNP